MLHKTEEKNIYSPLVREKKQSEYSFAHLKIVQNIYIHFNATLKRNSTAWDSTPITDRSTPMNFLNLEVF